MKKCMTIYYDADTGELKKVIVSSDFRGESALMQADVLQDVLGEIEGRYNKALGSWTDKLSKIPVKK